MNWRKFEEIVRSIVPERFSLKGDFYGWVGEKRPSSAKKVALTLDVYRDSNFSRYDAVISHHRPPFTPDFPLFVVHSALDRVDWGCHFSLAGALGLKGVEFLKERNGCIGSFKGSKEELLFKVSRVLEVKQLKFYLTDRIERVAVFSGCGFNYPPFVESALELRADVLISGDLTHHTACFLKSRGVGFIDAGHRGTELPGLKEFALRLRKHFEVDLIDEGNFCTYLCLC